MKYAFIVFVLILSLTQDSLGTDPKTRQKPQPAKSQPARVDSFTLKMTDFLFPRLNNQLYTVRGIRDAEFEAHYWGCFFDFHIGDKINFRRKSEGVYDAGTFHGINTSLLFGRKGGLSDPTEQQLHDAFGADAISDLRETSSLEVQHQNDDYWRSAIPKALKLSNGDTAQAAARLDITESDLLSKIKAYQLNTSSK